MVVLEALINRLRRTGALLLIGFVLIIYIALGFLYLQQGPQQKELDKQIAKISLIAARPLPSDVKLRQEYDAVNKSLTPIMAPAAVAMIVGIAEESGIDVNPDSGKLSITPISVNEAKVGEGSYQVLSFRNIRVQGSDESVIAFISDLDSGKTLETLVLKRVTITRSEVDSENVTTAKLDVDIYTKGKETKGEG